MLVSSRSPVVAGIDPGKKGGIVLLRGRTVLAAVRMADLVPDGAKWHAAHAAVTGRIRSLHAEHAIALAVLELYAGRAGQGRGSMLTIGVGWGLILGAFSALEIPVLTPASNAWTSRMFKDIAGDGKERSIHLCRSVLPDLDLKPGRCTTVQDGLADAGVLALYGQSHPLAA
jgi:hypothetical protein